jgi:hypothetical protein
MPGRGADRPGGSGRLDEDGARGAAASTTRSSDLLVLATRMDRGSRACWGGNGARGLRLPSASRGRRFTVDIPDALAGPRTDTGSWSSAPPLRRLPRPPAVAAVPASPPPAFKLLVSSR